MNNRPRQEHGGPCRPRGFRGIATTSLAALVLATVAALPTPANAQRPDTRNFTCASAWQFVQQQGAVVMTTGPYTFERLVSIRRYCALDEVLQRHFGQTLDSPRCFVGYACRSRTPAASR